LKKYEIKARENLNLITIRNISEFLSRITNFLETNDMSIVTCNTKPSKLTDIIITAPDDSISKISCVFKSLSSPRSIITIRSGVCCLSITSIGPSIKIVGLITRYFDRQNICIERIITTENEVLIFFPASEVCGCLNKFINDFENYLQTY